MHRAGLRNKTQGAVFTVLPETVPSLDQVTRFGAVNRVMPAASLSETHSIRPTLIMIRHVPAITFVLPFLFTGFADSAKAKEYQTFHENVLGTSLEIVLAVDDVNDAKRAESSLLDEIDRLGAIYSHYDPESEFSKLLSAPVGEQKSISSELASTLRLCEHWTRLSGGVFEPAVAVLSDRWILAEVQNVLPSNAQLKKTISKVSARHWQLDSANKQVVRSSDVPLSLDAIAKGVILDRVCNFVLQSNHNITGVMLNLGGDIRIAGNIVAEVTVADPNADAIGAGPHSSLLLSDRAVATSGRSERHFEVAGKKYSHIIDPRTGRPAAETTSATVIADHASTADAVATICSVLSVAESLGLVNSLAGVECMLINAAGVVTTSANWPGDESRTSTVDSDTDSVDSDTDDGNAEPQLLVQFEIAKPSSARRYRRPYVAVWIEDQDGIPVKTLCLFLMQNNPGPRWYRDLRRWYADDQLRRLADDTDLIKTVSKPTRNPGKYKVIWNGKDDSGKVVEPGEYTVLIEAAREHGSYQLMKRKFTIGESFEETFKPNEEFSTASIKYSAN